MAFGETITIAGTDYVGIFDDWSVSGGELDGPRVRMKTVDVTTAGVNQGSQIVIRAQTFEVRGVQPDGVGTSMVILFKQGTGP